MGHRRLSAYPVLGGKASLGRQFLSDIDRERWNCDNYATYAPITVTSASRQTGAQGGKNIGAFEARRKFGQVIEEGFYQKDAFIVERSGRPMAVIVSIDEYRKWRALAKSQLVRLVDEVWQRTQQAPAEALEAEVDEALALLRQEAVNHPPE